MIERYRKQIAGMTPAEILDLADQLDAETRKRGFLVRFAALGFIKELRQVAAHNLTSGRDQ